MPFDIYRDQIATQKADVIVVPANEDLCLDGGAGFAVAKLAGYEKLQKACAKIGGCEVGQAVSTPAFKCNAKHLVHVVGPMWDGTERSFELLESAYANALALCVKLKAKSIALPLISAGARGCPADISLNVALSAIKQLLSEHENITVRIILFSDTDAKAGEKRFPGLAEYIDDAYVGEWSYDMPPRVYGSASMAPAAAPISVGSAPRSSKRAPRITEKFSLSDFLDDVDESFSTTLLALIDEKGLSDASVYKRANISRQHFSKIRSNPRYNPTKKTVLALCIAMELDINETKDLLNRAGFALSHSSKADIIVEWFIKQGNCDIFQVNEALYAYDQPLLG